MDERKIVVPLLIWLIGGSRIGGTYNDYHGSVTRDPAGPMWGQDVFNYCIAVERTEDEEERLRVTWYPGMLSFANTPQSDKTDRLFPCSQDALADVEAWLTQEKERFFAD